MVGRRGKRNRDGNKKGVIYRWETKVLCNPSEDSNSSWRSGIDERLHKVRKDETYKEFMGFGNKGTGGGLWPTNSKKLRPPRLVRHSWLGVIPCTKMLLVGFLVRWNPGQGTCQIVGLIPGRGCEEADN